MTANRPGAGLEEIGTRRGISQAAADLDYLKVYASAFADLAMPLDDLVMILRPELAETANAFAEAFPEATIHFLGTSKELDAVGLGQLSANVKYTHCLSLADRRNYLRTIARPQVIIEHGNNKLSQKRSCFLNLFWALPDGGLYFVECLDSAHDPKLIDAEKDSVLEVLIQVIQRKTLGNEARAKLSAGDREVADSTAYIRIEGTLAVVQKAGDHLFKMRDWETNDVLNARWGDSWGEVIETKPGYSFESRALLTSHGQGPIDQDRDRTIVVPERYLRRYRDVSCLWLQIVTRDGHYLPDTFRHPHQRRQGHRRLVGSNRYMDRQKQWLVPKTSRVLEGEFYHFDTELPGHFGHITTEVLSRYWGWKVAVRENPSIRPLLGLKNDQSSSIPDFQARIFEALGVPIDTIEYINVTEEVRVESLVAATPQFENPFYVDLELAQVWRELAAKLPVADDKPRSERIFISRRTSGKRDCTNTPEVEDFFRRHGFDVIYPEDYTYVEQTHIFASALIIAGFGGSGMFNMMFAPKARIILISGESYQAANEYLFASANGNEIHYFWGVSDVVHRGEGFVAAAFMSNFTFALRHHRRALKALIT